jgi:hypothetical protein
MGWGFDYLGEQMKDLIINKIKVKYPSHSIYVDFREKASKLLEYGYGVPDTGRFKDTVKIEIMKEETGFYKIFEVDVSFTIKRSAPDNGLDYEYYEDEYEVLITRFGNLKEIMDYEYDKEKKNA